jgi:hypothetical protein
MSFKKLYAMGCIIFKVWHQWWPVDQSKSIHLFLSWAKMCASLNLLSQFQAVDSHAIYTRNILISEMTYVYVRET